MDVLLQAVLLLAVLLPSAPLPGAPLPPTPRELARAVLEAHGHDAGSQLRLLRLQGVSRTVRHCVAQVSVFAFLPDAPLSLLECGRQPVRAA
uniref:Potassium/sodium hyperpolarization-activated cyclic nucleotide-gated channel 4-like isoform X5 n=1 Tax=Coturnix japonica TaxID=93934 RepID=A0A1Q2TSD9_COTJA|nr:potassium/sodium hyperpolarization-activated cyclic nucleotide-gated channel 4-like isoform X5 [Coturnix japonica]